MHVVALAALARTIEQELPSLAADMAVTPYEARLALNAGFPAVILGTPDGARAAEIVARVRSRGHTVVTCDTAEIVRSEAMVNVRVFRFGDDAFYSSPAFAGEADVERLPWSDVGCLLRAVQRRAHEATSTERQTSFSPGRALLSGGAVVTKTKTREVTTAVDAKEQVLYLFRRSGGTPWIVRETSTNYSGLGSARHPATLQNFLALAAALRVRAPRAVYDERLVTMKPRDPVVVAEGGVDLLAHLLATSLVAST